LHSPNFVLKYRLELKAQPLTQFAIPRSVSLHKEANLNETLDKVNKLLHPYKLGFWSENNGGGLVVTNSDCSFYRSIGGTKWFPFQTVSPNLYNTFLELAKDYHLGADFLDQFMKYEGYPDSETVENALAIQEVCKPFFLAMLADPQSNYHFCLMRTDPLSTSGLSKLEFIFPGDRWDLYDYVPQNETSPIYQALFGGSLGRLCQYDVKKTLAGITAAKARL